LQFLFIFSYFIDGYAHAAEALIGKYIGANDRLNLRKAMKYLFVWGFVISVPYTVAYAFVGDQLLRILTNNVELIERSGKFLPWVGLIPFASFAAFIWDGAYIGATATAWMRNLMFIATLIVFLPLYYLTSASIGNHALWMAMIAFMLSRSLLMTVFARKAIPQLSSR
jgi:MATE family multidrug resistance protein